MPTKKKARKKAKKAAEIIPLREMNDDAEYRINGDRLEGLDGARKPYHYGLRKDIAAALKNNVNVGVPVYEVDGDEEENVYDFHAAYSIEIGCKRFADKDALALREWAMGKK